FPGVIEPETEVNLSFREGGRLIRFTPGPGRAVRKGELLAKLDPVLLQAAADAAKARYEQAQHDYERGSLLYRKNILAAAELEKKKRDLEVAEADYRNARDDLADSVILAPFDGIVSKTYADNYQQVKAGEVLIRLQDMSSFQVTVAVPEKEVPRFPPSIAGANRSAGRLGGFYGTLPALPASRFPLELKEAETQADTAAETFTVTFRILPQKVTRLLPGMSMSVHVPLLEESAASGFLLPGCALFTRNGKTWVWKIDANSKVHPAEVFPGQLHGAWVRVSSAELKPGDCIAQTGIRVLAAGDTVCPLVEKTARTLTGEPL
ncbi:MAG: efflux RND transporter periplasmic adaptor subunit, partial [Lentisphaeria bacterium]|nr:efflux RND transporter periplasmic adaptor subunit [Lentisphaeria bacterium]